MIAHLGVNLPYLIILVLSNCETNDILRMTFLLISVVRAQTRLILLVEQATKQTLSEQTRPVQVWDRMRKDKAAAQLLHVSLASDLN